MRLILCQLTNQQLHILQLHKLPFSIAHLDFTTAQIVINCTLKFALVSIATCMDSNLVKDNVTAYIDDSMQLCIYFAVQSNTLKCTHDRISTTLSNNCKLRTCSSFLHIMQRVYRSMIG